MGILDQLPSFDPSTDNLTKAAVVQNLFQNLAAATSKGQMPYQPLPTGALGYLNQQRQREKLYNEQQARLQSIAANVQNNPALPEGARSLLAQQIAAGDASGLDAVAKLLYQREGASPFEVINNNGVLYAQTADRTKLMPLGTIPREAKAAPRQLVQVYDPSTGRVTYSDPADAIGKDAPPKAGTTIEFDSATGRPISITTGRGGKTSADSASLGTVANNQLGEDYVKASHSIDTLAQAIDSYDPKFLTYGGQLKQWTLSKLAKIDPNTVTGEDRAYLEAYAKFIRPTAELLNTTIKDITGAALNQQEVPRIKRQVPTEDDDPITFMEKAKGTMAELRLVKARAAYLKRAGIVADFRAEQLPKNVPTLDGIKDMMGQRAEAVRRQALAAGATPEKASEMAREALKAEFGL